MARLLALVITSALFLLIAADLCTAKKHKLKKTKVKKVNEDPALKKKLVGKIDQIRGGRDESDEDEDGVSMQKVNKRGKQLKMQQKHKGVKVLGCQVIDTVVEGGAETKFTDKDGKAKTTVNVEPRHAQCERWREAVNNTQSGKFCESLSDDFPNVNHGQLKRLVSRSKQKLRSECQHMKITDVTGEPIVYIDEDTEEGTMAALVSIVCKEDDGDGNEKIIKQPMAIFDDDGEIIKQWDNIRKADYEKIGKGAGGNLKTGRYVYGMDKPNFTVKNLGNGLCSMEAENIETYWWTLNREAAPYKYACAGYQLADPINGAYSPVNDVHYAAQTTFEMFQNWYGTVPFDQLPVKMIAHYYYNSFNAYHLAGTQYYFFADGTPTAYPLATMDIVAHELAHGVVEHGANLLYYGEPGGLNEAFADVTAMAVLFFNNEKLNWKIADVMKVAGAAPLRDMAEPKSDGRSIDHLNDYYPGMDVHYSSGLYNKVFYMMSQTFAYGAWDAYDLMYHSLMTSWIESTGFIEAAEAMLITMDRLKDGSIKTPYTYSWLEGSQLTDIFNQVGIKCANDAFGWICTKQ